MRTIGAAERALEWMIERVNDERRKTFGQPLAAHGTMLEWIAKSRIEIDAARMTVLNAALKIDQEGAKAALREIAIAKVLVPQMALQVIDRAVQTYGAAGLCQDTPLPSLWASARTVRIVDGPDEVHLQQLGRREIQRLGKAVQEKLYLQKAMADKMLTMSGFSSSAGLLGPGPLKSSL
jgi:acyl-CoA dehydrogenase